MTSVSNDVNFLIRAEADVQAATNEAKSALGDLNGATEQSSAGLEKHAGSSKKADEGLHGVGSSAKEAKNLLGEMSGVVGKVDGDLGNLAHTATSLIGSAGGEIGLLGIAGAAVVAGGALVEMGLQGGALLTELMQLSAVTGLSVERVDFWSKALSDVGGNAQSLTMMARLLSNQVDGLNQSIATSNPLTEKQASLFNLLGGSIRNADGELKTGGDLIEELIPKLARMANEHERNKLGIEIFGRSWASVAPLIANYTQVSETATHQSERLAEVLGTDVESSAIKFNEKMTDIKTSMEILEVRALPPVLTLLEGLANLLERIANIGEITVHIKIPGLNNTIGDVFRLSESILDPLNVLGLRGGGGGGGGQPPGINPNGGASAGPYGPSFTQGYAPGQSPADQYAAKLKADAEAEKARIKAETDAKRAATEAIAEAERHLKAVQDALKDGTISYAESVELKLTPAVAGSLEVTTALATRHDMLKEAYFLQQKAVDGMHDALKRGSEAVTLYTEHLTEQALKLNESALGDVLGANTQEMARLHLQQAQLQQRVDQAPNNASYQRQLDAVNARIKAELDHVAILKAEGEVANKTLMTDRERDAVAKTLIQRISQESTLVGRLDDAILPFNTHLRDANLATMELTAGLRALNGALPGAAATPHAMGLAYVPYDGYLASLHQGEMVLTSHAAAGLRASVGSGGGSGGGGMSAPIGKDAGYGGFMGISGSGGGTGGSSAPFGSGGGYKLMTGSSGSLVINVGGVHVANASPDAAAQAGRQVAQTLAQQMRLLGYHV